MILFRFLYVIILSFIPMKSFSLCLTEKGSSEYSIVRSKNASELEISASIVLQNYLRQISGASFPIIEDSVPGSEYEILIGNARLLDQIEDQSIAIDGFKIRTENKKLIIQGKGKGTLYGVYTFLEKYLGCKKYSSSFKLIPKNESIKLPDINDLQNPILDFRSLHYWDAETDQEYLDWHKLNRIDDKWGLWGHSFFKLLPPKEYFSSHPEYFSLVNGERKAMQLCLTNPNVLKIVITELDKRMQDAPSLSYWSVSQNDGLGACECNQCSALNIKYKSLQGSLLSFVNQVAINFPDKIISTLAYTYSRKAPVGIKPRQNVNILFSTIDINRSKPVSSDPRSIDFRKEFKAWEAITHNIIIWDYVVQFTNYISPFPNLHTLKPNFTYFSKNKPKGFFIQGSVEIPGEFAELRTYLLAKLLWNPDVDVEELKTDFLNNYYGKAGVFIAQYIDLIHEHVESSWKRMDIYDNPILPFQSYLRPDRLAQYLKILKQAEILVKDDNELKKHVQMVVLPLYFAELQQSRLYGIEEGGIFIKENNEWVVRKSISDRLKNFIGLLKASNITQLNESGLSPEEYQAEWENIFKSGPLVHKAINKPVELLTAYNPEFVSKGARALVDGISGNKDFQYNWLGWNGNDIKLIVNMESRTRISKIELSFLENHQHLMFLPKQILIELSNNGKKFRKVVDLPLEQPDKDMPIRIRKFNLEFKSLKARYVKISAINQTELPSWAVRQDREPWLLIDEVIIN